ncbi:xylulokinase [[Eubacterium] cellulosolvens]
MQSSSIVNESSSSKSTELVLAVDNGVSVNRVILFDKAGRLVAESRSDLTLEQPNEGWAEQNPETIWGFTEKNIKAVVQRADVNIEDIQAVGITSHMHGTFLLDNQGRLARKNAIVWLDSRTGEMLHRFQKDGTAEKVFRISGWKLITSMQLLHLSWLRENEPETLKEARHFLACKDYLRYRLTGEILSDYTDASFTGLFDNVKCEWSEEAFQAIGLDASIAPQLRKSWETGGSILREVAKETGLTEGIPVTVGCGDVAAMALGAGVTEKNQLLANIGAAGVYERPINAPLYDRENRSYTIALHAVPEKWLLQANQMSAALALRWFRDNIVADQLSYKEFDELVAQSSPGAGGVIFHPFLQGERSPFVNPDAKGLFFGLTLRTELKDLLRAIFEGVALAANDNLALLAQEGEEERFEVTMGGGAANSPIWAQILSDVTGYPIKIPEVNEIGSLGAAILASLVCGLYKDHKEAVKNMIRFEQGFSPRMDLHRRYSKIFNRYKGLYHGLEKFYK